jgi:hypothetical protein
VFLKGADRRLAEQVRNWIAKVHYSTPLLINGSIRIKKLNEIEIEKN